MNAEVRRARVASLLLRGLTPGEIAYQLQRQGMAVTTELVQADVDALLIAWQRAAQSPVEAQLGRVLAELREVRRTAWAQGKLAEVYRGLAQESEILGLKQTPQARRRSRPRDFVAISALEREQLLEPEK